MGSWSQVRSLLRGRFGFGPVGQAFAVRADTPRARPVCKAGAGDPGAPAPALCLQRCKFRSRASGERAFGAGSPGPDSEDGRRWRPSWLRMRPLPPHIVGWRWPGPHDWGTIGGGRTGRGIGSGGACCGDGTNFPVNPPVFLEPRRGVARPAPDGSPGHVIKGDVWESQIQSSAGSRGHSGRGRSCGNCDGPNRRWARAGFPLPPGLVVGTYLDIAWFPLGPLAGFDSCGSTIGPSDRFSMIHAG